MYRTAVAIAAVLLLAVTAGAAPASAGSHRTVDPATVVPALNPDFAPWTCLRTGQGITCRGELAAQGGPEPIGLQCTGQDVYAAWSETSFMTRWHTSDGLATKTIVHLHFDERFSLSASGDSPHVYARGHWNRHYDYPVPGDRDSRVMTERGAMWLVSPVGSKRVVLRDVGQVQWVPGEEFETIARDSGQRGVYSSFDAYDAFICDQLTA